MFGLLACGSGTEDSATSAFLSVGGSGMTTDGASAGETNTDGGDATAGESSGDSDGSAGDGDGDSGDGDSGDPSTSAAGDGDSGEAGGDGDGDDGGTSDAGGDGDGDGSDASGAGDGDGDSDGSGASGAGDGDGDGDEPDPFCGDGNVDFGEQCDDAGESIACDADCTLTECGDGTVNGTAGEACDDAGESADCNADCTVAACGDGQINATAGESCDEGADNGNGQTNCTTACALTVCGDGYQGPSEACDDGNTMGGDGCSDACALESCGNSVVDPGEDCDDGGESVTCNANCTNAECGDGNLNVTAGEVCDDGGDSLQCDGDCTPYACGDGYVNAAAGEDCDDQTETMTCDADCTTASCGDGTLNLTAGESCDDGVANGVENQSDCMSSCTQTTCGDGYVGSSEACDDGNTIEGDACSADCQVPCFNEQFTFEPLPPNIVLVLDKSGSMMSTYDHDGDPGTAFVTRWAALHEAVTEILTDYEQKVNFGVKVFPSDNSIIACQVTTGVDVDCAPTNKAGVLASIPAANASLAGNTPSGGALQESLAYLQALNDPGEKAVIFMADGATTCGTPGDPASIAALIADAYNNGVDPSIGTYVVGINSDSDDTDAELNAYANAGGYPFVPNITTISSDGFESGDLSGSSFAPNPAWTVDMSAAANGVYAAHNVNIGDNEIADLTLDVNLAVPGSVSFSYRTDCESPWDEFIVYLDGVEQFSSSALASPWLTQTLSVPQGAHQVTFRYDKDLTVSEGTDTVWIDDLEVVEGKLTSYYDAQNTAALYAAMDQIAQSLITCDLPLSVPPLNPDDVTVAVAGTAYDEITDVECANNTTGWYYSIQYSQITLCGGACDALKNMSTPSADVDYYCQGGG